MIRTPTYVFALALAALLTPGAAAQEIETLSGTQKGAIQSLEGKGDKALLVTSTGKIPLESVKAIRWRTLRRAARGSKLVLSNGDWIRGTIVGGNEDQLSVKSDSLGALKVPLEQVRGILPNALPPAHERRLTALLRGAQEIDEVRLKKGGRVRGSIAKIDGTRVQIDTEVEGGSKMGPLGFDLGKVELIGIAPLGDPPANPTGLHVVVRTLDGSSLRGELTGLGKNQLLLKHPLGGKSPLKLPLTRVSELAIQNGRFLYLSDQEPRSVEQKFPQDFSYEVALWGFKKDRNVLGGKLRLDGRVYAKGLGVHSYCKLSFKLDKRFASFKVIVGLDDSTRYLGRPGFGGVVFRVLLDGKPAKELAQGLHKRKGQKASALKIDVKGKSTLTLIADYDPVSLHVLGRANWADAHLIRVKR